MTEILKQRVTAALGLAVNDVSLALRRPLTYQSNRLYDLRAGRDHWIVKEFCRPDEFELAPRREYQSLKRLERLDVAPRPIFLQVAPRPPLGPFVVYEYMPGQMWDRRRPAAAELAQLADIWSAFAELPVDDLLMARAYEGSPDQTAARWQRDFEAYAAWAEMKYPAALPAARLCQQALTMHQDMVDLADLIVHANQEDLLSAGEWQAFLTPYLAARRPADPGLERRLQLYQVLLSFTWLSILLSRGVTLAQNGRLNGWLVNEMPANQRLRRYLARVLAWPAADFLEELRSLGGLAFFPE
jgi:hypothetical protein